IRFMSGVRDRPFLCMVAHNALHRPEMAPAALVEKYARKPGQRLKSNRPVVAAMMEEVDHSVGRLVEYIDSAGNARDTFVIFTSDHGAFGPSGERKPLRGAKADLYEGGIRVPLIVRWPGRIAPGERETPVFGTDLFPTLLEICGLGCDSPCEGVSLAGAVLDANREPPDRGEFCWHFPHYHHLGLAPCGAIRAGRWKLIEWFERTLAGTDDGPPYELFDLENDPGESHDLSAGMPELCAELAARLDAWRKRVGAQEMKPNPRYNPGDIAHAVSPPPKGDPGNPFGE
ncbi:MAG TPA: sulfatase-like hydrolase/transferase, partial [Opitutaceae bacterium]